MAGASRNNARHTSEDVALRDRRWEVARQIQFTKEQREYSRKNCKGRLFAIAWEDDGAFCSTVGPANKKQLRYIKRAMEHVIRLGTVSEVLTDD